MIRRYVLATAAVVLLMVGLLLGLNLPENFKTPFFATNFSGFWSRWHISFSSWLQDYLFMPLAWADVSGLTNGCRATPGPWCWMGTAQSSGSTTCRKI